MLWRNLVSENHYQIVVLVIEPLDLHLSTSKKSSGRNCRLGEGPIVNPTKFCFIQRATLSLGEGDWSVVQTTYFPVRGFFIQFAGFPSQPAFVRSPAKVQVHQMSDVTVAYRLKSDSGLSAEISFQDLQQMTADGRVSRQQVCTPDNGKTWIPVKRILEQVDQPENATSTINADASSLSANDTTVKASSETNPEGLGGPRKLKRMSVSSGKSRFTKATVERS